MSHPSPPDRSKNAFGLMMCLNMLATPRVEPLVGPDSMVVGIK